MTLTITKSQKSIPSSPAPSAIVRPRAIVWKCAKVTDPTLDYYRLYRYTTSSDATAHSNYTVEDRLPTPRFRDEDALADDTNYWVRWSYVDTWGNESALTSAVNEKNRLIVTTDIATDAVTSDKIAASAVTPSELQADAVIPSKFEPRDTSNMIRDPELSDTSVWQAIGGTGTGTSGPYAVSHAPNVGGGANTGFSKYLLTAVTAGNESEITILPPSADIAVEPGRYYYYSAFVGTNTGRSGYATIGIMCYKVNASGGYDYVSSPFYQLYGSMTTGFVYLEGIFQVPAGVNRIRLYGKMTHSDAISPASIKFGSPVVRLAVDTDIIATGAVQQFDRSFGNVGVTCPASGWTTVATANVPNVSAKSSGAFVAMGFKNNQGANRSGDVRLVKDTGLSTTVLRTWPSVQWQDQNYQLYSCALSAAEAADAVALYLQVNPVAASMLASHRGSDLLYSRV